LNGTRLIRTPAGNSHLHSGVNKRPRKSSIATLAERRGLERGAHAGFPSNILFARHVIIARRLDFCTFRANKSRHATFGGHAMMGRGLALLLVGLLGGCMQATLAPTSNASLTPRDRQLLAHPPYAQASIPETYRRHIVDYTRREQPGTILVDTNARYLYYVLPGGKAVRYGVTVGEEALAWSGVATVGRTAEWPDWIPTAEIQARLGPYPKRVAGGPANPLGARALYLYEGNKDTLYRIHGTNQPEYIGQAISSGCIRMTNEDVIDLVNRVKLGTIVVVLPPGRSA
jgi:lipoprotein-anchoring transpeptidase ErfK/SrfK